MYANWTKCTLFALKMCGNWWQTARHKPAYVLLAIRQAYLTLMKTYYIVKSVLYLCSIFLLCPTNEILWHSTAKDHFSRKSYEHFYRNKITKSLSLDRNSRLSKLEWRCELEICLSSNGKSIYMRSISVLVRRKFLLGTFTIYRYYILIYMPRHFLCIDFISEYRSEYWFEIGDDGFVDFSNVVSVDCHHSHISLTNIHK